MSLSDIPFDVLTSVLFWVSNRQILLNCLFVSRQFRDAAITKLYESITLRSPQSYNGELYLNALHTLQLHPELRLHVRHVRHHPSTHEARDSQKWERTIEIPSLSSLAKLPNLKSYTFIFEQGVTLPAQYFAACTQVLEHCMTLNCLDLGFHVELPHVPGLMTLTGRLSSLSIASIDEDDVATSLSSLFRDLKSLSLWSACNIQVETFTQISTCLKGLTSLDLGLPHRLDSGALLSILSNMPNLLNLDLFLMWNPHSVSTFSGLPKLERLILRHQGIAYRKNYENLFRWLGVLVAISPLTSFSLLADDERLCTFPSSLIKILLSKLQLEFINIPYVELRSAQWDQIVEGFRELTTLSFYLADSIGLENLLKKFGSRRLSTLYVRSTIEFKVVKALWSRVLRQSDVQLGLWRTVRYGSLWHGLWSLTPRGDREGIFAHVDEYGARG
ncbi:hypothetical protein E4T56_gene4845 [Termitomyces sp. T112]|nr:hypothetical protein E4T56_gene4845 [Termitomyces sp. T112]